MSRCLYFIVICFAFLKTFFVYIRSFISGGNFFETRGFLSRPVNDVFVCVAAAFPLYSNGTFLAVAFTLVTLLDLNLEISLLSSAMLTCNV